MNQHEPLSSPSPVLGLAAFSGVGKTTLLRALIPLLQQRGVMVAVIKQTHHHFEIDTPGKDSYQLRMAGAREVLLTSPYRDTVITEKAEERPLSLQQSLQKLDLTACDLILVEGFRQQPFPKIELHRPELNHPLLSTDDRSIIAIATDSPQQITTTLPRLPLSQPSTICDFILLWLD
ncbi:MAG: molybdopterin-guanine dinucleotide biosynthesis protein B [Gammaproteobacteria bacterium]|nr:molybdopterin-guanine dinucleotide biosynthesis protein B [Gammaproteobacteria bacterium]